MTDVLDKTDNLALTRRVAGALDLGLPKGARIIVAMSGGVDSSVTAALCHYAGYDVVGVTLQLYDHGVAIQKKGACCAGQDIHDARRVAEALGIPHYVLDYENRFSDAVMEDFADTYLAGATPIPCVRCNERVKFKDLLETARDLGGAAMATGHYIAREIGDSGKAELRRAADADRDQSYFLFTTTQDQLDFLRFPLGHLPKPEVRAIAAELGLVVADKPDSQDICFVPEGKYTAVVERLRPGAAEPGEIVHVDGTVMGTHPGVIHYTVGQRRGLGIATGDPLYVVKLDADKKQVVVGPREALTTKVIHLKEANWLGDEAVPEGGMRVAVKVRSTRPPEIATLRRDGDRLSVVLDAPEDGVSPGQACVFYTPDDAHSRVLGGGWIASTEAA
ncbi:tRNA 2-thiouridine(34) synthase MnmA [Aquisalinus flavus]|uniref:tRNA-specific 2-thiouridylase MnmA n=1 Tax=Aquisalinus flavus TaxID=1526572 RepID=A0A8J2V1J1_9PROT|nr:tRNA 2-thiouridine(34) synthase MnmA [Aquisalinus flavus]MBD0426442.1 tRNA 2-thiouridine(34) synthase MnmA [Aquisalinus flavus]UNE48004.1 tRNA 2-thiouridine(34) synthase MnmA [Aquisalinus flavus]GGD07874.1 tRNA-specific 2-thiouridylase MnmA [Aquisalinus flavus]